jgi:predicted 3-demethylubiquinone-9 3-methyltransferase (glyoxalase superfamily)
MPVQRISPCLWFDGNGKEAAAHYVSIFDNSRIVKDTGAMVVFELDGLQFLALNGGPMFKFNEAVSMSVTCADQAEVDRYWDMLLEGGTPSRCGWLKDKFGLSWQIVPNAMESLLGGDDAAGAKRAMQAMMGMVKLDIAELERAYKG